MENATQYAKILSQIQMSLNEGQGMEWQASQKAQIVMEGPYKRNPKFINLKCIRSRQNFPQICDVWQVHGSLQEFGLIVNNFTTYST